MWHAVNYYWLAPQFVKYNQNHHTNCISLHLTFTVLDYVKPCIARNCDTSLVFLICKLLGIKASAKWINVNDYYLFDSNCYHFTFTFTFMHLADAFIQSDLQLHSGYTFSLVCVFPGNRTHNLLRCWCNDAMLYHWATQEPKFYLKVCETKVFLFMCYILFKIKMLLYV